MSLYSSQTVPFANPYLLQIHFDRHKDEVGATSEADYERMADAFMSQPSNPNLYDGICVQVGRDGSQDRIRLDNVTRWYGVAFGVLTVRTLHTKRRSKINRAGGPRAYVDQKCLEIR